MMIDPALAAANNFTSFKVVINNDYRRARHLDYIDYGLMEVARYLETGKGIRRLIIEAPPRHGKSLSVSEMFPAWILGRNPNLKIILASYASTLAERNSRNARNLVREPDFTKIFPHIKLDEDLQRVEEWGVIGEDGRKGSVVAVGMGGSIVGKGASCLIIDDPHRNRADVESEVTRESTWTSYTNDLLSRFDDANRAAQIIIAQRYHTDDLIGRVLKTQGNTWAHIRLPALAEADDMLGRQEGEALWPERFNEAALEEIRRELGAYSFSSQYQQNPVVKEELTFDTTQIRIVKSPPKLKPGSVRFYDTAVTTETRSDFTCGLKMAISDQEDIVVLDVVKRKLKAPDLLNATVDIARKDGREPDIVLESTTGGIVQLSFMERDERLRGYKLHRQAAKGDKSARAAATATRMKAGQVILVEGAWNKDFIDELAIFPAGKHDDQVDAFSGAYNFLADNVTQEFTVQNLGTPYALPEN